MAGDRVTCSICFREFLTDERGRIFRHVRQLREQTTCLGSKFPPAGISLRGTEWALDRQASIMLALDIQREQLDRQPDLNGLRPYSPMYVGVWYQAIMNLEAHRERASAEAGELAARLEEWLPTARLPNPATIHRTALWKCRAGTAVPLCFSASPRRPMGDPIMVDSMAGVDCPECLAVGNNLPP